MKSTASWTAVLASGAVLALAPVAAHGISGAPNWKPQEHVYGAHLDHLEHLGCDRILAYDHHGNPAIAVYDTDSKELRYCRRVPGVGWSSWVVDATGAEFKYPSLAFDRYERPAIAYYDMTNTALKYAYHDGSAWNVSTLDGADSVGMFPSLAFDIYGRPWPITT